MIGQCKECGQDIIICNICGKLASREDLHLEFERGRIVWGPIHDHCLHLVDINMVRNNLHLVPRLEYHPNPHSRDVTTPHNMNNLLGDIRTRPTEPPIYENQKEGKCSAVNHLDDECRYVYNHGGDHSWERIA